MSEYRAGYVALIGRPNVGKSTLMNHVIGQKIAIVSPKAQTTRKRVMGILTTDTHQIVFVDTPGMHRPVNNLGKRLNETAQQTIHEIDLILVMVDSSTPPGKDEKALATVLEHAGVFEPNSEKKIILCLNKMDLLKPEYVEKHVTGYTELFHTDNYMFTSLTKNQNIDKLLELIVQQLPISEPLYDKDQITDQPMNVLSAELIRESALNLTKEEVPYSVTTTVDTWEESEDLIKIQATIIVERSSQKGIIIGKQGSMLKKIGTTARLNIEKMVDKKVYLELFVKVEENWRSNPRILKELQF